jgi:hypothetical protein
MVVGWPQREQASGSLQVMGLISGLFPVHCDG